MANKEVNRNESNISYISTFSTDASSIGDITLNSSRGHNDSFDSENESVETDTDEDYFDDNTAAKVATRIPFATIHKEDLPFTSEKRKCFQPGQKISVKITRIEVPDDNRLINPNVYVIDLKHGDYEWTVKRRHKHFRQLHEQLMIFKARVNIPYPTRKHQERRKSMANVKFRLPHFPKTPDRIVDDIEARKAALQSYLQGVVRIPLFRNHHDTLKFLEVSHLSFVNQLGRKWREGSVRKRSGGHKFSLGPLKNIKGCVGNCRLCEIWHTRWLVLKDTCLLYVNPDTGVIRDVMLMDREFKVKHGKADTGIRHGLIITNLTRKLTLKSWTSRKAKEWWRQIDTASRENARDFTQDNRYDSFAPNREDTPVKWFVDAATYMAGVANALETAKEEIFITDWWLSPEVFLKRPIKEAGSKWRLDLILKQRAEAGVRIFIMLYKEMQVALGINSFYTKQVLQDMHPNIRVLRHPDGIALWSHHEKCVVIDQRIAFLGGIDLCYGRWDTPDHRLVDLGSMGEYSAAEDLTHLHEAIERAGRGGAGDAPAVLHRHSDAHETHPIKAKHSPHSNNNVRFSRQNGRITSGDNHDETDHKSSSSSNSSSDSEPKDFSEQDKADLKKHMRKSRKSRDYAHMFRRDNDSLSGSGTESSASSTDSEEIHDCEDENVRDLRQGHDECEGQEKENQSHGKENGGYGKKGRDKKGHDKQGQGHDEEGHPGRKHGDSLKEQSVTKKRPEEYIRSASVPHDIHFHDFHKKPMYESGDHNANAKKTHAGKLKKGDMKQRKAMSLVRQLSTIDSDSEIITSTDMLASGDSRINSADKQTDNAPVQTSDTSSQPTQVPTSISQHSAPLSTLAQTQPHSSPLRVRRKLPQIPKDARVIRFATPYKDSELTDGRDAIALPGGVSGGVANRAGHVNSAFEDSEESDGTDTIVHEHSQVHEHSTEQTGEQTANLADDEGKQQNGVNFMVGAGKLPKEKGADRPRQDSNVSSGTENIVEAFALYLKELAEKRRREAEMAESGSAGQQDEKQQGQDETQDSVGRSKWRIVKNKFDKMKAMGVKEEDSEEEDNASTRTDKQKRARLERQQRIDAPPPGIDPAQQLPFPVVLNAKKLSSSDAALKQFIQKAKPSTPPSRRKKEQQDRKRKKEQRKAEKAKRREDKKSSRLNEVRSAFKTKRSKSVGVPDDVKHINLQAYRRRSETPDDIINKLTEDETYKLWIGKDYTNFIFKDFVDLDRPFDDFIDREHTPRMPWHDIGVMVYGKGARDVARHFIQRWNFTKISKRKDNRNYPLLLPKAYKRVPIPPVAIDDSSVIWANSQILRSSSHWSAGIKYTEHSIMNAYVDMITNAKHFIYIENQFFVTIMGHDVVENKIAEALYNRIKHAYRRSEKFVVIVVLPLLPAFEGELGTPAGSAIQAVTHWNYSSICRGGKSLLERLVEVGVADPFKYISFYGLRTHAELNDTLTTELVYVHSKMMIVDDCRTIIGSANINDRSMLGKRDSELAIIVDDTQHIHGSMAGKPVKVGQFSHSLRMAIFREHLGINPRDEFQADISDPVATSFYNGVWKRQAQVNTQVYDQVFRCIPCDDVRSWQELKDYQKIDGLSVSDPDQARKILKRVRGNLVVLPLQFLGKESSLAPAKGTKESLAPTIIWT